MLCKVVQRKQCRMKCEGEFRVCSVQTLLTLLSWHKAQSSHTITVLQGQLQRSLPAQGCRESGELLSPHPERKEEMMSVDRGHYGIFHLPRSKQCAENLDVTSGICIYGVFIFLLEFNVIISECSKKGKRLKI